MSLHNRWVLALAPTQWKTVVVDQVTIRLQPAPCVTVAHRVAH